MQRAKVRCVTLYRHNEATTPISKNHLFQNDECKTSSSLESRQCGEEHIRKEALTLVFLAHQQVHTVMSSSQSTVVLCPPAMTKACRMLLAKIGAAHEQMKHRRCLFLLNCSLTSRPQMIDPISMMMPRSRVPLCLSFKVLLLLFKHPAPPARPKLTRS